MKVDLVTKLINPFIQHQGHPAAWDLMDQVSPRAQMNWRSVSRVVHLEMLQLWETNGATEGGVSWRRR